jgi:hypothetical protein
MHVFSSCIYNTCLSVIYSTLTPECLRWKAQNLPLTSKCKKCLKRQIGILFYPETCHFTHVSARCTRTFYIGRKLMHGLYRKKW